MSTDLSTVLAWQPEVLSTAASDLDTSAAKLRDQAGTARTAMAGISGTWTGFAASAAAERGARNVAAGMDLAAAIGSAKQILSAGASSLGQTKSRLQQAIDAAHEEGFNVDAEGTVTAPSLPPYMTTPEDAAAAALEHQQKQDALNARAQEIADEIGERLTAVLDADSEAARQLTDVDVPADLSAEVRAYLDRLGQSKDVLGSLGALGAGGIALAKALKDAAKLGGKGFSLVKFLNYSSKPITDYATFQRNMAAADDALRVFSQGKANGGLGRFFMGSKAAKIAGKAFLPLTMVTGAMDAVTGGGYDGARGWATRGFGLAGAGGAGALLFASASLGPVGLAVAGGAVLAYGAWTLGNAIYDNWDDITEFGGKAVDWAGDRLSDAGDAISDVGSNLASGAKSAAKTLSFGLLG